jgi:CRISPR-associated endonuclease/helicase Cas3
MLFSCLVDADYMDTERFMQPDNYAQRSGFDSLVTLKQRFDSFMETLSSSAQPSLINIKRSDVLDKCRKAGLLHEGIFNLTVPTGGGKTLSSLAFALEHAIKYDKKRIIVAIPYTSIITQTAQVFRNIFGNENVVEHHSNLDGDTLSAKQKLATENWDAPIIVTTNVQLFESLYSNRSSHCRKLHNLSHSILILDEAQMLPIEFLKPILSSLNTLVKLFDVTLLCTTATQPVLSGKIGSREAMFSGFKREVTDIVTNAAELTKDFKRVTIELPEEINTVTSFDEIADELKNYEQVLCIVNTRKESQNLYSKMPETTLHLSRMMCSAHILDTIKVIKDRLLNNQPVRVISTQLIEAGVDIDFPIVYRAFAGLDSIAQAAGRCNREGHLNKKGLLGKVKVFNSEKGIPPGYMRKSADVLKEMLLIDKHIDLLSPLTMTKYFEGAFSKVNNFDKPDIKDLLWKDERYMKFQFATAARDFKLIDDAGSKSFVVRYHEGADYIEMLKNKGPESWLMRKLQHYTVSVREADFKELVKYGHIECFYGIWVQTDSNLYNSKAGVVLSDQWISEVFIL